MPVESEADRLAFLDSDEFGVQATFGTVTVEGIFLDGFEPVDLGGGSAAAESVDPVFVCRASDVPSVAHESTLTISSVTWTVRGIEPDGEGMVRLRLSDEV